MMIVIFLLLCIPFASAANPKLGPKLKLFNGKNLDGFYTYLEKHGKDNDPDHVFRVENGELTTVHETAMSGWWAATGCSGFLGEPFFVDARHGWIGLERGVGGLSGLSRAGMIATQDGGVTWSCVDGLPSEDVSSVRFVDPLHGWVTTRSDDFGAPRSRGIRVWRTDDGGRTWSMSLA